MKNKIRTSLQKLLENYKKTPICRHITLALGEYQSIEFVSDRVFSESLDKYIAQLELEDSFQYDNGEDFLTEYDF